MSKQNTTILHPIIDLFYHYYYFTLCSVAGGVFSKDYFDKSTSLLKKDLDGDQPPALWQWRLPILLSWWSSSSSSFYQLFLLLTSARKLSAGSSDRSSVSEIRLPTLETCLASQILMIFLTWRFHRTERPSSTTQLVVSPMAASSLISSVR